VIATLAVLTYGEPTRRGDDGLTDAERALLEATP
jgi:hypothetical protein